MITKKDLLNKNYKSFSYLNEEEEDKRDEKETNNGDFAEMMSILLHSQTQSHTLHLQTESYSEHKALQNYYEGIDGIVDGLVESYQGKYGIISGYENYNIDRYKNTESTIKYLSELYILNSTITVLSVTV